MGSLFVKTFVFFTAVGLVRGTGTITDNCKCFSIYNILSSQQRQLRDDFKNFSLTLFDIWYVENNALTTWQKNNIKYNKYYQWHERWLGGFIKDISKPTYSKWFITPCNGHIFNNSIITDLSKLGGIQQAEKELDENVLEVKDLVEEIGNISDFTLKQKNFFLYDESNYINHTFYTELNKKIQIYDLISTAAIGIKTMNLIRPRNSLKFRVLHNKYMDHIVLQLEDIRKPGKIETKDTKVPHFSILSTKPKRKVASKRKMSYQLVDEFRIVGLQNYNVDEKLNPIEITIHDSKIQGKLSR